MFEDPVSILIPAVSSIFRRSSCPWYYRALLIVLIALCRRNLLGSSDYMEFYLRVYSKNFLYFLSDQYLSSLLYAQSGYLTKCFKHDVFRAMSRTKRYASLGFHKLVKWYIGIVIIIILLVKVIVHYFLLYSSFLVLTFFIFFICSLIYHGKTNNIVNIFITY